MKKLTTLFLATILTTGLFAQNLTGKLSGTVTSDGQPLVGANVVLQGTSSGAATGEDGSYYIFDVQPGIYTVQVNYIGYQTQLVSNVRVTIGLTTIQDFELAVAAVEGETVEVTAEKPLIEVTATNVQRTMDSEAVENYAVRNVTSMVASQAGVVNMHDGLHVRGSRSEEIGYTLEGASMRGAGGKVVSNAIPEALEAIAVQTGGFDASIGGANAGMVQQSLKTGSSQFSASVLLEGMNGDVGSEPWSATGDQDMTITVQGPIGDKIRYFGALRTTSTDNYSNQSRWFTPFTIAGGNPIPDKIGGLTTSHDYVVLSEGNNFAFKDGANHDGIYTADGSTGDVLVGENKHYAFDNTSRDMSFNGTLQYDLNPLVLRLAGTYTTDTYQSAGLPIQSMFNSRRHETTTRNHLVNLKATYFLSTNTYLRANFSTMGRFYETYDKAFKDKTITTADGRTAKFELGGETSLKDWLAWGDRDAVAQIDSNWANHFGTPGADSFAGDYRYVEPSNYNINGFRFQRDGARRGGYSKGRDGYFAFDSEFVTQLGEHEVKVGGKYTNYTYQRYSYTGISSLNSKIGLDPTLYDAVVAENTRAHTNVFEARLSSFIGYDPLGNEWDANAETKNEYDKPRNPWNFAMYVNDKFEAGDLIVNAGVRYEAINQANVELKDFNNPPLDRNYRIVAADDPNYGFKDMATQTYLLPRIGLGFPISDQSSFRLNYGKYVQMAPMNRLYRSRASGTSSWGLLPTRETKFEVGYGTLLGDVASVDITVFTRNPEDQVSRDEYKPDPTANAFGLRQHTIYTNTDFSNVTGIELDFKSARVNGFQLFANYVFQDVRGLNSYPTLGTIGWGKSTMISATRYDQRHQASAVLDFRTGRTGNVITDDIGMNMVASFNSGHPYTLSDGSMGQRDAGEGALLSDNDPRNRAPREAINSSTTPSIFNLDLNVEKTFAVPGVANVKVYATITNLLNTQHIINVYNRTGDAYDDGFLNDPDLSSLIIEGRGPEYVEMYRKINLANRNHWLNDHSFDLFGIPREFKTGIQVSF